MSLRIAWRGASYVMGPRRGHRHPSGRIPLGRLGWLEVNNTRGVVHVVEGCGREAVSSILRAPETLSSQRITSGPGDVPAPR